MVTGTITPATPSPKPTGTDSLALPSPPLFTLLQTLGIGRYIKTPLFVIQNQFDKYQLSNVMGLPGADHGSDTAQRYLKYYGQAQALSASQVVLNTAKSDGLWLASCFDHTGNYMAKSAANMTINGTRIMDAVGDWFFGRNMMSHHIIDDCGAPPCNPACPH